jgi:hypothetical protein
VLESELLAEVSREHPLFGAQVIAIARCEGCDEVVLSVATDPARFVSVHLTWRRGPGAAVMAPDRGSGDATVAQPCSA